MRVRVSIVSGSPLLLRRTIFLSNLLITIFKLVQNHGRLWTKVFGERRRFILSYGSNFGALLINTVNNILMKRVKLWRWRRRRSSVHVEHEWWVNKERMVLIWKSCHDEFENAIRLFLRKSGDDSNEALKRKVGVWQKGNGLYIEIEYGWAHKIKMLK